MSSYSFIDSLSDVQRKAATEYEGASLVIAGAGSGKTRVLTSRIAYMIACGVSPNSILSLTFTNKAAREMRERIMSVVDESAARGIWMGTFHSVFARILRQEAEHIGFTNSFTIYETADSRNLVKTIIKEMKLSDEKYKPKEIFARISLMKNGLTTPAIYANQSTHISDDIKAGRGEFAAIYRTYMARCKQSNAMDFDDLLLYTNILFKSKPDILKKYQDIFKYILVDEYQDTNFSQYLIVKKISEVHKNVCVVGDDAQSIYSFRGAKIENILKFQQDYPNAVIHRLEQNYRSTQNIVSAANSVIKRNSNQLEKNVFSKNEEGDLIALFRADGDREEAYNVARDIEHKHRMGVEYDNIAILYRTNSQSKAFEDQLRARAIPYKIYGGQSFYQRKEIKDILAYIRLVVNSNDDEALKRIINFPARGIGSTSIGRVEVTARENNISLWRALTTVQPQAMGLNSGTANKINSFIDFIKQYKEIKDSVNIYDLVFDLITKSGIIKLYRDDPKPESQSAYENVEELVNSLKKSVEDTQTEEDEVLTAEKWVQEVALLTDMDEESDGIEKREVTLMTIHSSKGLEFNTIYVVGVEEGTFPSSRSVEEQHGLEEERRLFYVAITRAIKNLTLSFATSRYKWGSTVPATASRFLKEVDNRYIDSPELLENSRLFINDIKKESSNIVENKSNGNFRRIKPSASTVQVNTDFTIGDRVSHQRFGYGNIVSLEPFGDDFKVTIKFDIHDNKVLLMKFAKLEKI